MNKVNQPSISLIQLWFWLIVNFIGWLFVGCLGCLAVSIVIVSLHGQQAGFAILQNLIQQDYAYLLQTANPQAGLIIHSWLQKINSLIVIPKFSLPQQFSYMQSHLHRAIEVILPYVNAIILGLNLLIIRVYLLLRWCPLFLLLGLTGLIDGLAQRSIRRASAGRESALIYHQAKPLIIFSLILGIFVYLILPVQAEQSEWILVVAAILFGISFQVTAKSFKKYL